MMNTTTDERNAKPIEEILKLVNNFSKLEMLGFKESFRSEKGKELIYDSEWCRISTVWSGWDPLGGNSISINYGRLHAPNESATMIWNGEECYAWHGFKFALYFLDGYSPTEALKMQSSHPLTSKYHEEEYRKKFKRRQPEWLLEIHAEIWRKYGNRFFELFDLRRPELWDQYRVFLKEFYDIKGRSRNITPSQDKVC
jgi:hypothetical protein